MESLPHEIKLNILRNLTAKQIIKTCLINKEFSQLCRDESLWKKLVEEKFGNIPKKYGSWYNTYLYTPTKMYVLINFVPEDELNPIIFISDSRDKLIQRATIYLIENGSKISEFTDQFIENNNEVAEEVLSIIFSDKWRTFDDLIELTNKYSEIYLYIEQLYDYLKEALEYVVYLDDESYIVLYKENFVYGYELDHYLYDDY